MNENRETENNNLANLPPEYIKTDGEYDLFVTSLFIIILFFIILIIRFMYNFISSTFNKI